MLMGMVPLVFHAAEILHVHSVLAILGETHVLGNTGMNLLARQPFACFTTSPGYVCFELLEWLVPGGNVSFELLI